MTVETREQRQERIDAKVAGMRLRAESAREKAEAIRATVNDDPAFWTQPAYGNTAGRSFSNQRDRERKKLRAASDLAAQADAIAEVAASIEARGAVMRGDAHKAKRAEAEACTVKVGDEVRTIYGLRKVIKVNRMSIVIDGDLIVQKHNILP